MSSLWTRLPAPTARRRSRHSTGSRAGSGCRGWSAAWSHPVCATLIFVFGGFGGLGLSRHTRLMRLWFGLAGRMGAIWSSHLLARSRDDGAPVRTTNQPNTDLSTPACRKVVDRRAIVAAGTGGCGGARCGAAGGAGIRRGLPRDAAHGGDSPSQNRGWVSRFGRKDCHG